MGVGIRARRAVEYRIYGRLRVPKHHRLLGAAWNGVRAQPQLRWTPLLTDNMEVALALERASDSIDAGQIRRFSPELDEILQADDKVPDVTGHWRRSN